MRKCKRTYLITAFFLSIAGFSPHAVCADDLKEKLESASKKLKDATERTRTKVNDWRGAQGKEIQQNFSTRVREITKQYGPEVQRSIDQVGDRYGDRATSTIVDLYERYGPSTAAAFERTCQQLGSSVTIGCQGEFSRYYPRIQSYIDSPEIQEKAISAAMTAMIYSGEIGDLDRTRKRSVEIGMRHLAENITVKDESGRLISLDKFSQAWIGKKAPFLRNTSVHQDPVGSITYLLMFQDPSYAVNDMRIVPSGDGEYKSLSSTLYDSSPQNAKQTLKVLSTIGDLESVVQETNSCGDISSAARSFSSQLNSLSQ